MQLNDLDEFQLKIEKQHADYILLRKSITKEILRHKKEIEKKMNFELEMIKNQYERRFQKLTQQYNDCLKHLLIKRENENAFIGETNKIKAIISKLKLIVD
jgi:hypothetical protein